MRYTIGMDSSPTDRAARELLLAFLDTRPEEGFPDHLANLDDLRTFAPEAQVRDLAPAQALRDELAQTLLHSSVATIAEGLTAICEKYRATPAFERLADGVQWRIRDVGALTGLFTSLIAEAIALWDDGSIQRIRVCESSSCIVPFIDTSRRQDRMYCSPRCATRERVRKHRALDRV